MMPTRSSSCTYARFPSASVASSSSTATPIRLLNIGVIIKFNITYDYYIQPISLFICFTYPVRNHNQHFQQTILPRPFLPQKTRFLVTFVLHLFHMLAPRSIFAEHQFLSRSKEALCGVAKSPSSTTSSLLCGKRAGRLSTDLLGRTSPILGKGVVVLPLLSPFLVGTD